MTSIDSDPPPEDLTATIQLDERQLRRIRAKGVAAVIALLLVAQALNAGLSISNFEKLYTSSTVSFYRALTGDLERRLSRAIALGKSLESYYGIEKQLEEITRGDPRANIDNVLILSTSGEVLYGIDLGPEQIDKLDASRLAVDCGPKNRESDDGYLLSERDNYHVLVPICGEDASTEGMIDLYFSASSVRSAVYPIVKDNVIALGLTTLIAAFALVVAVHALVPLRLKWPILRVRLFTVFVIVLAAAQIAYSAFVVHTFRDHYVRTSSEKASSLSEGLQRDLDRLLSAGLSINKLLDVDELIGAIRVAVPEVDDVQIRDLDNTLIANRHCVVGFEVSQSGNEQIRARDDKGAASRPCVVGSDQSVVEIRQPLDAEETSGAPFFRIELPLSRDDRVIGRLSVLSSQSVMQQRIREVIMDCLTVLAVSLLFMVELVILLLLFIKRELAHHSTGRDRRFAQGYGVIRPVAFLYLFAMDLPVSFLPMLMARLYDRNPLAGMSREVAMGLPLSATMFSAAVMLVVAGGWMQRSGWRPPFIAGAVGTLVGAALAAMSTGAVQFILARSLMGAGYGLTLMSVQGFTIANTRQNTRGEGLANLTAGIYSGSICGTVVGAMLSERLGFGPVFIVSGFVVLLAIAFVRVFVKHRKQRREAPGNAATASMKPTQVVRFLLDRHVLPVILLASLPSAICTVGFLYYAIPIFLEGAQISQSNIGRVLMIYGVFLIYAAPFIGRIVDRRENKRPFIFVSGVCGALGLVGFHVFNGDLFPLLNGIPAVGIAVGLLGLAGSLGSASRTVFVLNSPAAQALGSMRANSIYRLVDRGGQILGPIIVSLLWLTMNDMRTAILWLGGGLFLVSLLFVALSRRYGDPATSR